MGDMILLLDSSQGLLFPFFSSRNLYGSPGLEGGGVLDRRTPSPVEPPLNLDLVSRTLTVNYLKDLSSNIVWSQLGGNANGLSAARTADVPPDEWPQKAIDQTGDDTLWRERREDSRNGGDTKQVPRPGGKRLPVVVHGSRHMSRGDTKIGNAQDL